MSIPKVNYNFVRVADVEQCDVNSTIDLIGVVRDDNGVNEIVAKASGKPVSVIFFSSLLFNIFFYVSYKEKRIEVGYW